MAACELGIERIPCVVSRISNSAAKRLVVNLNTIHGEPNAELLAPFLADLSLSTLREIHIEDSMKKELLEFDESLASALAELSAPSQINRESPKHSNATCKCPKCGVTHFKSKKL